MKIILSIIALSVVLVLSQTAFAQKTATGDSTSVDMSTMCLSGEMPTGISTLVKISTNPPTPVRDKPLLVSIKFNVVEQNYSITATQDGKTILSNSTAYSRTGLDTQTTASLESSDPVEIGINLTGGGMLNQEYTKCGSFGTAIFHIIPKSDTIAVPEYFMYKVGNRTLYHLVTMSTSPATPVLGQPMSISLAFTDVNGMKIPFDYEITATQDGKIILSNPTVITNNGNDIQTTAILESSDPVDIKLVLKYTPATLIYHVIPEFPLTIPILLIGIVSVIVFYRMKFDPQR